MQTCVSLTAQIPRASNPSSTNYIVLCASALLDRMSLEPTVTDTRIPMTSALAKMLFATAVLTLSGANAVFAQSPAPSSSPFMAQGTNASAAAAPTENAPLELRGIVSTKQGYIFGLYDPSKRQSMWVRQNDPGADFTVRSHDVANDTVNVEYQGRTMTLALKAAKVESLGPVPNPAQVVMQRPGGQNPQQQPGQPPMPAMNPSAAQEAARLEGVAAEVRRRRMLRQQASQPGAQPNQPPMPAPQPGAQPLPR